jgi:hypothetical protein
MAAESFFSRWATRNTDKAAQRQAELADAPPVTKPEEKLPPPTLEDVAKLAHDSDFAPFVARGVDEHVRRSAMKKLFTDPRFNVMDGLDIYIDDYSKSDPMPAAMLAALNHGKSLLDPLAHLENSVMRMIEVPKEVSMEQKTQSPDAPAEKSLTHASELPEAMVACAVTVEPVEIAADPVVAPEVTEVPENQVHDHPI